MSIINTDRLPHQYIHACLVGNIHSLFFSARYNFSLVGTLKRHEWGLPPSTKDMFHFFFYFFMGHVANSNKIA